MRCFESVAQLERAHDRVTAAEAVRCELTALKCPARRRVKALRGYGSDPAGASQIDSNAMTSASVS
jgi:hypothetical protein